MQSRQQSSQIPNVTNNAVRGETTVEGTSAPHFVTSGAPAPMSSVTYTTSSNNPLGTAYMSQTSPTTYSQTQATTTVSNTAPTTYMTRESSYTSNLQQQYPKTTTTTTTTGPTYITREASYQQGSYSGMNNHGSQQYNTTISNTSSVPVTQYQTSSQYQQSGAHYQPMTQYGTTNVEKTTTTTTSTSEVAPLRAVSYQSGTAASECRVVGREVGEGRLVSVTERVDESRSHVINERIVEHEIRVPKKILREEIIEKVIVVPEKTIIEEIVDETAIVKEKIVEVAKPTIVEKVIEIPEIEYVERIVEIPQRVVQEKIREVEKIIVENRIVEVPKIEYVDKIVEVPEVHYRDVPVDVIVEVPEWKDEIIYKEVPVPQYVNKPVPQHVQVEVPIDVERLLPVPVEAEVTYEYRMPHLKPRYAKVSYPVYLPRFIEVPVAVELLNPELAQSAEGYLKRVDMLTKSAASLCEIENLAATIMKTDFQTQLSNVDLQTAVMKAWNTGSLQLDSSNLTGTYVTTKGPLTEGIVQQRTTTATTTQTVRTAVAQHA